MLSDERCACGSARDQDHAFGCSTRPAEQRERLLRAAGFRKDALTIATDALRDIAGRVGGPIGERAAGALRRIEECQA